MLAVAGILIWALFGPGGLDRALTSLAFDPALGRFPLRDSWLLTRVGHDGLKWAMLVFWVVCLAWQPLRRGAHFASHVPWTAWIAWAVTLAADALNPRRA